MNNPYLPLSNYFREDQRASNFYKDNMNDRYMPYVRKREELIKRFSPASNMNNDFLTDKIGREYSSYNRIPYEIFHKDNPQKDNRYQIEFNDYDNLNKKIYHSIKTPSKSVDVSTYKIEPITSIEYDSDKKEEKKLTEEDYRKYFEYMREKERGVDRYLPAKSESIQYTPAVSQREAKEYQRKVREREEELMKQYRMKKTYTECEDKRMKSSDIAKHSKYYDDYCIKDEKRDLTIIDRYCDDNNCNRKYKLKCNICNYDNIIYDSYMVENKVGEGSVGSCPCCNSRIVVTGINDIATTDTWMIPYLKNNEDAFKYGGFKIISDDDYVFAYARFNMNDVFISECRVVIRVASKEKAELHII